MAKHLCISIHFLGGEFHGRGDHGESEWPPSPLRLFQALVAAGARLEGGIRQEALQWLERQSAPSIVSSGRAAVQPRGYRTYVPDNVGDIVATAWAKGAEKDISGFRTDKFIRPLYLEEGAGVHYLWHLPGSAEPDIALLVSMARAVSHLGWGIDLVVADAAVLTDKQTSRLNGERWLPSESLGGNPLRVPVAGTLEDLKTRYEAFLERVSLDSRVFKPVPPLTRFTLTTYRRVSEMTRPPFAVFALRRPDDRGFAAFAPTRRGLHLSGMLRYVARQPDFAATLGWDDNKVASFILGHGEPRGDGTHVPVGDCRLVILPLPSIEYRGAKKGKTVGAIRRVLVTVRGTIDNAEFGRMVNNLEGRELIDEKTGQVVAFLRRQLDNDGAITSYFTESSAWTSVTPVILPGYDDPGKLRRRLNTGKLTAGEKANIVLKLEARIDSLLRKALRQAGCPDETVNNAQLQWRGAGFIRGVDLASQYAVPDQHRRHRRLHVRIDWQNPEGRPLELPGPFCVGGGRFTGLGLFTAVD
jgi:CRISPR-associated protein Csb2